MLRLEGDHYVFSQDYAFTAPSAAASVVWGRSQNGRVAWVDNQGRTLKDIQTEGQPDGLEP